MSAVSGPFFEDLAVGMVNETASALTLTDGHAAIDQAIVGDRLRVALDASLAAEVIGTESPVAHPALVCDVAIGQSTLITHRVIVILFYRGLVLRRGPAIGDTRRTGTEVVALRQNSARPGPAASGLVVLRVRTADHEERTVLDFWRCAMLPLRDRRAQTGHDDDLEAIPATLEPGALRSSIADWRPNAFAARGPGPHLDAPDAGMRRELDGGDVVSGTPQLVRLGLNIAIAHHDRHAGDTGRRLVYGGHTIGLGASQATRILPNIVTILAWHGCDHIAPVYEGDTVRGGLELERVEPIERGGLLHLRFRVRAHRTGSDDLVDVLDWRFVALMAQGL